MVIIPMLHWHLRLSSLSDFTPGLRMQVRQLTLDARWLALCAEASNGQAQMYQGPGPALSCATMGGVPGGRCRGGVDITELLDPWRSTTFLRQSQLGAKLQAGS